MRYGHFDTNIADNSTTVTWIARLIYSESASQKYAGAIILTPYDQQVKS